MSADQEKEIVVKNTVPKKRQELLKWNGWGYEDSKFVVENGVVYFTGNRYPMGDRYVPHLSKWILDALNVDFDTVVPCQDLQKQPDPLLSPETFDAIKDLGVSYSIEGIDRLFRAHDQTLRGVYTSRHSFFRRIPDVVLWPKSHSEVVKIVDFADRKNLVIIVFGGGTSVSGAIECPHDETRTIISLDTSQMNGILWINSKDLIACCESGIIGQDLERELNKAGFTSGHEPDSYEFSSLGGWVATRASGMKKNTYGNIEDLVVHVKMVTAKGVLEKRCQVPRLSCGPDFDHVILGCEGSYGVITEVTIKIRSLPKCKKYGSLVFSNFELGVRCMREIARRKCQPTSIRLMDNEQLKFGQNLKPKPTFLGSILEELKILYVTKIRGFDVDSMVLMTLLFEGDPQDVSLQEKKIYRIADGFGGIPSGEGNGEKGYVITFIIAYIRDLGLNHRIVSESFETSVAWSNAIDLYKNVKHRVSKECEHYNIKHYLICTRVSQTYDAGCLLYFYLIFNYSGHEDPVGLCETIEGKARDEVIANGGSISHHHGIGKIRRKWYPSTVSEVGVALFNAIKNELDPNNIFATGNIVPCKL